MPTGSRPHMPTGSRPHMPTGSRPQHANREPSTHANREPSTHAGAVHTCQREPSTHANGSRPRARAYEGARPTHANREPSTKCHTWQHPTRPKSLANREPSTHANRDTCRPHMPANRPVHATPHQKAGHMAGSRPHMPTGSRPHMPTGSSCQQGAVHTWLRRLGTDIGRPTPPGPLSARKPIRFPWESGREPRVGSGRQAGLT